MFPPKQSTKRENQAALIGGPAHKVQEKHRNLHKIRFYVFISYAVEGVNLSVLKGVETPLRIKWRFFYEEDSGG
jgi:hypothetical protein